MHGCKLGKLDTRKWSIEDFEMPNYCSMNDQIELGSGGHLIIDLYCLLVGEDTHHCHIYQYSYQPVGTTNFQQKKTVSADEKAMRGWRKQQM